MTTVLVVDDEPQIRRALTTSLEGHGFATIAVAGGREAVAAAARVDLVLLDLGLPDLDGTEVIRRIRDFSSVPIIVLSVRGAQGDKVRALDAGADDYLTKPFAMEELLARTRAALRRATGGPVEPVRCFGDLVVDLAGRSVTRAGHRLRLSPREFELLRLFVTNPGTLLTHGWLLSRVWGADRQRDVDALRHAVRSLRVKLGDTAAAPELITTEPGLGYRWVAEPAG
ncbi:MAG: DNA-binding response regulator [Actinomycetota bacterium]|nr:MAG: DNA-binding response regulator [Actinomycetota bacterium]